MATTTDATVVPSDDWISVVDGDDFASCLLQVTGVQAMALAVATSKPAAASTDFVLIGAEQPLVPFDLVTGEAIWCRGFNGSATVRTILVAR